MRSPRQPNQFNQDAISGVVFNAWWQVSFSPVLIVRLTKGFVSTAIYRESMKGVMDVFEPGRLRVGLDVVLVPRVEQMYRKRPRQFVQRFFTEAEMAYCLAAAKPSRRFQRFAGRIAAKEAVMKVLGRGWPYLPWTDVEIARDGAGQPRVKLSGKAQELMERYKLAYIQGSITHDGKLAAAVAVGVPRTTRAGSSRESIKGTR